MTSMPGMDHHSAAATSAAPKKPARPAMNMTPTGNRKEPYGTHPLAYTLDHGVKVFHLTAEPVRWRIDSHTVVNAWAYNGQVPGPVIRVRQGDRVRIVFTNRLPEQTTIHWHGIDVPNDQDGVPGVTQEPIPARATFTYHFRVTNQPGLYAYHPHYDTMKQEGLGMYGAFVVDPRSGPVYAHEMFQVLAEQGGYYLINGKSFPSTDAYAFHRGDRVLIRTINMGVMSHPMHLHGFSFTEVGANGGTIPVRDRYPMFTQDVAPGTMYDAAFTANRAGVWLYHCHILSHVTGPNGTDAGMITAFKVSKAGV
jgi:manganese oxidase